MLCGIDLVDISRMRRVLAHPERLQFIFTPGEIEYCYAHRDPAQHLSSHLAAKEALLKALGIGWSGPVRWTDICVTHGLTGAPELQVTGAVLDCLRKLGFRQIRVSLSHAGGLAVAQVLVC